MKQNEITHLLEDWKEGDNKAMNKLMDLVYENLKSIAHRHTIKEDKNNTLNTTGLVHEAYLQLLNQRNKSFENRSHFYAIISTCMRRTILQVARAKKTHKRGAGVHRVELEDHFIMSKDDALQIISVNDALEKLETIDPKMARIVEYRYFSGMKLHEISDLMSCSLSTVKRHWRFAKNWLQKELSDAVLGK